MDKKNKIYTAIIVVVVAITAYFIYNSTSHDAPATPDVAVEQSLVVPPKILPLGNKFDTSVVKKIGTDFNIFNFPQVSKDEVGISTSDLIKSEPTP